MWNVISFHVSHVVFMCLISWCKHTLNFLPPKCVFTLFYLAPNCGVYHLNCFHTFADFTGHITYTICPTFSGKICISSFRCKVCPLTFFSKSDIQIHSKSHTEAKPHKCPHCTKSFANASYLAQHLRIHLGVKPYHCSYCEKSFRQLSHLQQHTRWPYSLGLCTCLIWRAQVVNFTLIFVITFCFATESTQVIGHINVSNQAVKKPSHSSPICK